MVDLSPIDESMNKLLKSKCTIYKGLPINPKFIKWKDHIYYRLTRPLFTPDKYSKGLDAELFAKAKEHANTYCVPSKDLINIALTHTLYLFLCERKQIEVQNIVKEGVAYIQKVNKIIDAGIFPEKAKFSPIESLYPYLATTSIFAEEGLVSKVIWTNATTGYLLYPKDIPKEGPQILCLGGSFDKRCLKSSTRDVYKRDTTIVVIEDLELNCPQTWSWGTPPMADGEFDWPKEVLEKHRKTITLDALLKIIKENPQPFIESFSKKA